MTTSFMVVLFLNLGIISTILAHINGKLGQIRDALRQKR